MYCTNICILGFNTVLIKLWKDSGPCLQALHFSYAFGGFVAPLMARHFISERQDIVNQTHFGAWPQDMDTNSTGSGSWPTDNNESMFRFVYWISSALYIPTLLAYAFYAVKYNIVKCIRKRNLHADGYIDTIVHTDALEENGQRGEEVELMEMSGTVQISSAENGQVTSESHSKASAQESTSPSVTIARQKQSRLFDFGVITALATFILVYVGIEVSYGSWIFTVAVTGALNFSKSKGAIIQSLYWGMFAFTRLFSVLLAMLSVRSSVMLVGNLTGSLIAASIMVSFPHNAAAIWVGSAVLGMSYASVFPTTMTWMSETINAMGVATTVLFGAGSVGVIAIPAAVGGLISISPDALFYLTLVGVIISAAFVVLLLLARHFHRKQEVNTSHGASGGEAMDQEAEKLIDSEEESGDENTTKV